MENGRLLWLYYDRLLRQWRQSGTVE